MIESIEIIEGEIKRDVFGSWEDCSPGLYIDMDRIETIFSKYIGKKITVRIQVCDV